MFNLILDTAYRVKCYNNLKIIQQHVFQSTRRTFIWFLLQIYSLINVIRITINNKYKLYKPIIKIMLFLSLIFFFVFTCVSFGNHDTEPNLQSNNIIIFLYDLLKSFSKFAPDFRGISTSFLFSDLSSR